MPDRSLTWSKRGELHCLPNLCGFRDFLKSSPSFRVVAANHLNRSAIKKPCGVGERGVRHPRS